MLVDSAVPRLRMFLPAAAALGCLSATSCDTGTRAAAVSQPRTEPGPASLDPNSVLRRRFLGRPAPSLDGLVAIGDDSALRLRGLRGRVVERVFWAPWCGVCHMVADDLNQWQQEFGSRVQVIGISTGTAEQVSRFAPRLHMEYLVAADPEETVSKAFGASAVPMVFVIDPSGIVRAVHLGYSSARMSAMKQLVTQLVSRQ